MRYLLFIIISINIFSMDFRENSWGSLSDKILEKEKVKLILYKENLKSKNYKTSKGEYKYNYKIDEYSFDDTLESLGEFLVTYSFLQDKLIKGSYTKEFKSLNPNKGITKTEISNNSANDFKSFERAKQYLIWKYGEDYKSYGLSDNYEWNNGRSKITLNYFPQWGYIIEYFADTEDMKEFIDNSENGKEFIKELDTEFKEFNRIKYKL